MEEADQRGLLRLPNEILLEVTKHLNSGDPGLFSLSTSCRRLHYLVLPIYLAAYGIPDAAELSSKDLSLQSGQLEALAALQTSLFIRSLKHISCSFSLNSARPAYCSRDMDHFFRHIRRLASFLSILERLEEVTLSLEDVNFWVIGESLGVLETWASVITTLLDVIMQTKSCKILKVQGGMFIVHSSQFQRKSQPLESNKRRSVMAGVTRRFGSKFLGKPDLQQITSDPGKWQPALETFNIHSRVLLLHPCYSWTMGVLRAASNLKSLSIARVDIPESSWDDFLSTVDIPALEDIALDLRCRLRALPLNQFLGRHPLIRTLSLGHNLLPLEYNEAASKDSLPRLTTLSAPPSYVRFLMASKNSAALHDVHIRVKVSSHAPFKVAHINHTLAPCRARLAKEQVHVTLAIAVDYASSHWTGFFPDDDSVSDVLPKADVSDSLQYARALEFVSLCPSSAFEALALRWLPTLPRLRRASFSNCLKDIGVIPFVRRVKEACPTIEVVTVDGTAYDLDSFAQHP